MRLVGRDTDHARELGYRSPGLLFDRCEQFRATLPWRRASAAFSPPWPPAWRGFAVAPSPKVFEGLLKRLLLTSKLRYAGLEQLSSLVDGVVTILLGFLGACGWSLLGPIVLVRADAGDLACPVPPKRICSVVQ